MKIHLAGNDGYHRDPTFLTQVISRQILRKQLHRCDFFINALQSINILESFYYLRKNDEFMTIVKYLGSFMLDSGAFTFISGNHNVKINWDEYVNEYAAFINKHDVKLFFELEILTGKKTIPVWHRNRGKDYFIHMCKNYPYVALGGVVTKEIPIQRYETYFPWFIMTAHENGAKIHGLGYTRISNLKKYHFDSVDSTAWIYGNLGGYLYKFNPSTFSFEHLSKDGYRLKSRESAVHNFNEWVKFCKYAETHL